VKAKRISASSVFIDRHICFVIWVDDFDIMHDLLYRLPSDLAFCCVGLTHNSSLILHSGHPVRTDCRSRFPVSIKLSACESLNPGCMNKICKKKGETQSKILNCTKNISLHSGRVMVHLIPLNELVASDTVVCYFRCLQSFKNIFQNKLKNRTVSVSVELHYCCVF